MTESEDAKTLFFRALDERREGRHAEAEALLRSAMALAPERASIRINLCGALIDQGKHAEALPICQALVQECPDQAVCWHRLSVCEVARGLRQEALTSIERCLELEPDNLPALFQKVELLLKNDNAEAALQTASRLVELAPDDLNAHLAMTAVHDARRDFQAELASRQRIVELSPHKSTARWYLALAQLMTGDLAQAWQNAEARWTATPPVHSRYEGTAPRWDGKSGLKGKRPVVWAEQGLGDCIQFLRYLPAFLQSGNEVVLQVPEALCQLLGEAFDVHVVSELQTLPAHDFHLPLWSLPACMDEPGYLPAPLRLSPPDAIRESWQRRLGQRVRPRVGLMWQGNVDNPHIPNRSITLPELAPILELPFEFHCVSNVIKDEDLEWLDKQSLCVHPHVNDIQNLADTAGLLSQLDLLVTIDTSIAHLGPSLGMPTWVLLLLDADWRWGPDEPSPWYPESRLFRQQRRGDWTQVVAALREALVERFGSSPSR